MRYEVAARIFFATVRAARHHREFSTLDHHRQNEMLRRGWAAAFVLRAAIWPVDLTDFRKPLGIVADDGQRRALAAARAAISSLRPDRVEFSVLETLVLCRPGKSNRFYDFTSLTPSFAKQRSQLANKSFFAVARPSSSPFALSILFFFCTLRRDRRDEQRRSFDVASCGHRGGDSGSAPCRRQHRVVILGQDGQAHARPSRADGVLPSATGQPSFRPRHPRRRPRESDRVRTLTRSLPPLSLPFLSFFLSTLLLRQLSSGTGSERNSRHWNHRHHRRTKCDYLFSLALY